MDDLDALLTPTSVWKHRVCHVAQVLEWLDPEDAAKLAAAIDDEHVPLANIEQWVDAKIANRGARIGRTPLTRHRRRTSGGCACP